MKGNKRGIACCVHANAETGDGDIGRREAKGPVRASKRKTVCRAGGSSVGSLDSAVLHTAAARFVIIGIDRERIARGRGVIERRAAVHCCSMLPPPLGQAI